MSVPEINGVLLSLKLLVKYNKHREKHSPTRAQLSEFSHIKPI